MTEAALRSLAIAAPERVLTNDHWRREHPRLVAEAEERLWMWKKPADWSEGSQHFNRAMEPYLADPFRGASKRRYLPDGTPALEIEAQAARDALGTAEIEPGEIDLLLCTSFLPDATGIGGAAFLARELGLQGAAWNLESACSSTLIALQTAAAHIRAGLHRRVLVVTSCTYSRVTKEDDPIAWGVGDGAVAMILTASDEAGFLGGHSVHSADTCGTVAYHLELDEQGQPYPRLRTGKTAARLLRETSERYLETCTSGALRAAGLDLEEIDFFVFNTPLAWYAPFCAAALGIAPERSLSVYPIYANLGPALLGFNLFHAAKAKRIEPGQRVLLYSVGSVSSCAAAVLHWGEVALGALPSKLTAEDHAIIDAPLESPGEHTLQAAS